MKRGFVIFGVILLLFSNACTPNDTILYNHPKDFEDTILIHQSNNDLVTMSIFGGKLEPFNGKEWYITAGKKNLITIVIELCNLDENLWLKSINISTIDNPIIIEVLNHHNGKWENPNRDKPSFAVFQAQIYAPAFTVIETTFNISAEIVLVKEKKFLFSTKKELLTTTLSETVTTPVRVP